MTVEQWLDWCAADAERRGLREVKGLLEGLARQTSALRQADWHASADGETPHARQPSQ